MNYYNKKLNKIISNNDKDDINLIYLKLIENILFILYDNDFYEANYYKGTEAIERHEFIKILSNKFETAIEN